MSHSDSMSVRTSSTQSSSTERYKMASTAKTNNEAYLYDVSFVFELLHRKNDLTSEDFVNKKIRQILLEGVKHAFVRIPDTIIYKNGYPAAW